MLIRLKEIKDLFQGYQPQLEEAGQPECLTGFHFLKDSILPLSPHQLYLVTDPGELMPNGILDKMNLLIITQNNEDRFRKQLLQCGAAPHLLFLHPSDRCEDGVDSIYKILQGFFEDQCGLGLFAESMLRLLVAESGIQAMIDRAFLVFQNPIFFFDAGFSLAAANWDEVNQMDNEEARRLVKSGGITDDDLYLLNRDNHLHKRVSQSEIPIQIYNEAAGCDQLLCCIDTKQDLGHLVVDAVHRPFLPSDHQFLQILKKAIAQQLKKDAFVRSNKGFNHEYYLRDLLDGKVVTNRKYLERMNYMDAEFAGSLYCLVVDTARSSRIVSDVHVRFLLDSILPNAKTLIYNGKIIALICRKEQQPLPEKYYREIENLCQENDLFAGISNCFQKVVEIQEYYYQALRAIEIGIGISQSPALFRYCDFYLHHIAALFTQKESAKTFCHPGLKVLLAYDEKNGAHMAESLYAYLTHERNIGAAAQSLGIHRNTMVYRLGRIDELFQIDYEDYHERQYLILSYELCQVNS